MKKKNNAAIAALTLAVALAAGFGMPPVAAQSAGAAIPPEVQADLDRINGDGRFIAGFGIGANFNSAMDDARERLAVAVLETHGAEVPFQVSESIRQMIQGAAGQAAPSRQIGGSLWVVVQLNRDSVSRAFSQLANIGTQSDDDFVVRQNPDNTLTITGWRGSVSDVVIPDYLWGLRVTGIAANAFYRNREGGAPRLTSVAIPGTVTVIEVQAFAHNSLVQVTLAEGLERIEANAFLNNPRLSRIALPDSLTALGRSAFARCGITEIGFGRGLREIGAAAFADNNLTSLVIPSHVTNIEESAFAGNQIAELALPEGLVSIGGGAFADNNIRSVTLPASLRTLSPGVFNFNPIENLTILPPLPQMDNSVWQTFTTDVNQKLETLTRLSIPAGMSQGFMELNFPENLVNFWVGQGRAAGTYVRRGPIWARE